MAPTLFFTFESRLGRLASACLSLWSEHYEGFIGRWQEIAMSIILL